MVEPGMFNHVRLGAYTKHVNKASEKELGCRGGVVSTIVSPSLRHR
jgi:hypothetical protein